MYSINNEALNQAEMSVQENEDRPDLVTDASDIHTEKNNSEEVIDNRQVNLNGNIENEGSE